MGNISSLVVCFLFVFFSCYSQNINKPPSSKNKKNKIYVALDTVSSKQKKMLPFKENAKIVLSQDIDLANGIFELPKGVTLIPRGGHIKNGILYGNQTKIRGVETLFDHVTIRGSWQVKNISTSLFADLNYDNALRDVIALCNNENHNDVLIEKGDYWVNLFHEAECGIMIPSNTNIKINGTLHLKPNELKRYYIVYVGTNDVSIEGCGEIIGDKEQHINKGGEWGMGVRFQKAYNCKLKGITIKDCWGDCVCVSMKSKKIEIDKCTLVNGRRQGISVTSADHVDIKNCIIKDVHGTAPEYAIDIEPDSRDTVKNILVKNVIALNCGGGFSTITGVGKSSFVRNVEFNTCSVEGSRKSPFYIAGCEDVLVKNSRINNNSSKYAFNVRRSENVRVENNVVKKCKYVFYDKNGVSEKNNKIGGCELYFKNRDIH